MMTNDEEYPIVSGEPEQPQFPMLDVRAITMDEILVMPQDGPMPTTYWFSGAGRALFAEERAQSWLHIEYVFPVDGRLFELRWSEGKAIRLWSMHRRLPETEQEAMVACPRQRELVFPVAEIQLLEHIMRNVPQGLKAYVLKLALDALFVERTFPQRSKERFLAQ